MTNGFQLAPKPNRKRSLNNSRLLIKSLDYNQKHKQNNNHNSNNNRHLNQFLRRLKRSKRLSKKLSKKKMMIGLRLM